jgi:hypothetical protein
MPRIRLNLADIPDAMGAVEVGSWPAVLRDVSEQESSTGNPMWVWSWEVTSGPSQGSSINSYTSLMDHALFGLKAHLEALGADATLDKEMDINTDRLLGREVVIVVGKRKGKDRDTGEDREFASINRVLRAGGDPVKTAAGAKAGRKAVVAAAADDDDELPF